MMSLIELAIDKALAAHAGQRDKAGRPYILHPLRVMLAGKTDAERIVGVLHDVLEDGPDYHVGDLAFLPDDLVEAVVALTRQPGEDYMDFCRRAGANPIARRVKIADLRDNLSPDRQLLRSAEAEERRARYRAALAMLEAIENGTL